MIYWIVAGSIILVVVGFLGWKLIQFVKFGAGIGDAVIKASGNGNKEIDTEVERKKEI